MIYARAQLKLSSIRNLRKIILRRPPRKFNVALALLVCAFGQLCIYLSAPNAQAAKREPDHVTFSGYYTQYSILHQRDSSVQWPGQSADVELAVRVYSIASLVASLSNSIEPESTELGASPLRYRTGGGGVKIDIPGLFFFGVEKRDFSAWTKSYPLNLFAIAEILGMEMRNISTGELTAGPAERFGLGLDVFPGSTLSHFTVRVLMFNYLNSNYLTTAIGGGITF